jgi:dienelactone hydrolase
MIHRRIPPLLLVIALMPLCAITSTCVAAEQAVNFCTTDGLSISATLTMPDGAAPALGWPALLMIQGSGPTDRDGNSTLLPGVKIDNFKQIAQVLAAKGIATLRYDKRGMDANHAQLPADESHMAAFFDWDHFVGDAIAGYHFLTRQPQIYAERVGLLGHSEGSSLALAAADKMRSDAHAPCVLILLSAMGRTEDNVLHDQLNRVMDKQGASAEQKQYLLDENARIVSAIKRTGQVPADVPAGLAFLYQPYLGPFLRGSLSVDDTALAARYPGPVLVIAGERDIQVSPTLDGGALDAALKTRHPDEHLFVVVPGASHELKHVDTETDPGFAGPIVAQAMSTLVDWCVKNLAAH